jgi:deoxyribodipyrimidine photolyase-related protein
VRAVVVWGTQLSVEHNSALQSEPDAPVLLIESRGMCRRYRFHQQKLFFLLTAMREFADEVRGLGRTVHQVTFDDAADDWFEALGRLCRSHRIDHLVAMRQNDRGPQRRLEQWCERTGIGLSVTPNTLFLTPAAEFRAWARDHDRLQLETFYRWQRRRLGILLEPGGEPVGGRWNYDADNRKPMPKGHRPPPVALPVPSRHAPAVRDLVQRHFGDHPGRLDVHWLPTTRAQASDWLDDFIEHRFARFGDYEDAMAPGEPFLYHSALSPLLNVGLLHPRDVLRRALAADVPLAGKEGFVRQVIGWREFLFGLYHHLPAGWRDRNFFAHRRPLPDWWWTLDGAPEPPLADVLDRVRTYGYSHHIERLMVLGNYMLLAGYRPAEVYRWFMTMYVDAYEWVMVPNVIGMSQFADGGIDHGGFATKPYISGSNYLQKMGRWWPGAAAAKESQWTPMYWDFLERHRDRLAGNHRLQPVLRNLDRRR